jgi:hypothetical protein
MKLLKTQLLTILFILTFSFSHSQVTKFKTTSGSTKIFNENTQRWKDWEKLTNGADILITLDITNERIKIFSKTEQVFDIIKYFDKKTDDDGDDIISFQCVDQDGLKCKIRFVILNSQEGRKQVYIDYSDMIILYNIYTLN